MTLSSLSASTGGANCPGPSTSPPARDLAVLDETECLELLATVDVGRLAVATEDGPEIFPVNFAIHDGAIVLWTGEGRKLAHASFNQVAFEVDVILPSARTGWVVEARGHTEDITDAGDPFSLSLRHCPIEHWVTGRHGHCIAIARPKLSGRRLIPANRD